VLFLRQIREFWYSGKAITGDMFYCTNLVYIFMSFKLLDNN